MGVVGMTRSAIGVFFAVVAVLAAAAPSQAAFPGHNGKIAFTSTRDGDTEIFVMNPDGTGQTPLTSNTMSDTNPSWSPDGKQITFVRGNFSSDGRLWVMDADGGNPRAVSSVGLSVRYSTPSWSPDGSQIAFTTFSLDLALVNADGTGFHYLTNTPDQQELEPAWSPAGSEIAFTHHRCVDDSESCYADGNIRAIEPDGTNARMVTDLRFEESHFDPNWSPAGQRIAFSVCGSEPDVCPEVDVHVIDAGGSNESAVPGTAGSLDPAFSPDGQKLAYSNGDVFVDGSRLTTDPAFDGQPDWQPIPVNGYPRPRSAGELRVSLVPANVACNSPNRIHGPPLAMESCAAPRPVSTQLTVGAPDANGVAAKATGYVLHRVRIGDLQTAADEADVRLEAAIKDVRNAGSLSDHAGGLSVEAVLRATDSDNTPHPGGPGAATVSDGPLTFDLPCVITADPTVGSTCSVSTSADAILAGTVKEGRGSVWQFGRVVVRDGAGSLFMTQGIFVP